MPQVIQRSFTAGEISPSLRSRADLVKYTTGLATCENFIIRSQGGAYSRPGTKFIGEIKDSSSRARLIPFQFNTEQTYILVFEDQVIRFIKDGGFILDGVGPALYEIVSPYLASQLDRLIFTQDADVMTITHPLHDPRTVSRLADDNWVLDTINYAPDIDTPIWAPSQTRNITAITQANPAVVTVSAASTFVTDDKIALSGIVGMVTLNGTSPEIVRIDSTHFLLKDVDSTTYPAYVSGGTAVKSGLTAIGTGAGSNNKTYTYVVTAISASGSESLASTPQSITTGSLSVTAGVRLTWQAVTGADYYRVYKDPSNGTEIVGWIGDSKTTTFDDYNVAPVTSDTPADARVPFAGLDNSPACCGYHQQRLFFGRTNNNPQTVYSTQIGIYNSLRFSQPARDDDAITFEIKGRQVNEIRHIISLDTLVLLTSGAEWRITEGQDQVLTPSSVGARIQSYYGASWVYPVVIGDSVVYVQEKGSRVRDLKYLFSDDKVASNDLSIMSEHLFENNTIIEMTYSAEPFSIVWLVRDDGVLLGLTYQREHQVVAWHKHTTDGLFESVATISEDNRDATYVIVNRTIEGNTKRYVERFEPRDISSAENVYCVDCGLSYDSTPASTFSGLDHLEGETVVAVADGNVVKDLVVSGGSVILPRSASKVSIGLPYTCVLETLDLDVAANTETLKGRKMSVSNVIIDVEKTRGGWVGPKIDFQQTGAMYEIKPRFDSDSYDALMLRSYKQEINIDPQWSRSGGLRIEQRDPMPMAILSVVPEVDLS